MEKYQEIINNFYYYESNSKKLNATCQTIDTRYMS